MKQRWGLIALVAVISFVSGGWLLAGARSRANPPGPEILQEVLQRIGVDYVDSLAADSIYHLAAAGAVKELNDPYSALEEDEDYKALTETTSGNYGGLGLQIDVRGGWITVVSPLPQTPAEKAGIEAGDQIVEVNSKTTQDLNQDQAVHTLRGVPGTRVDLKVHRPGLSQLLPFSLVRQEIHFRSVQPGVLLDGGVGYVSLMTVSDSSASELRQEINGLLKRGMKGLVLDLRQNPGGLLTQGTAVSDLFLDPGQKIVETRGRMAEMNESFVDHAPQEWPTLPVVVLVNEYTASAAEIISGALQDNDRAVVVGTATFGKGLVQTLWQTGPTEGLKLTTGRWYTPSGRTIQRSAKSQEDQMRQAEEEAVGRNDKHYDSLPTFKTISGRLVRGGGGIVPDRIVRLDTLSDGEKDFAKALGSDVSTYRDALTAEALDLKEKKAVANENFTVTDAMRDAVVTRLKAKKVALTPEQVQGGSKLINDQLSYEISRYVFGREAELRRRTLDDPQVRAADQLLLKAATPKALMSEITGGNPGK
ncbi:MAG TPA: S41 family peptidase [Gemmatimonadales bacterium]|jgi:carboxyl-terminal processing protease|nr:S41 family peptidase [Gemmatimonadales bacterium]